MKSIIEFMVEGLVVRKTNFSLDHVSQMYNRKVSQTNNYLGSGAFGTAYKNDYERPTQIVKVAKTYQENPYHDPYVHHAVHSMNNYMDNVHLPRVEKIRAVKTPTGNVHITKMEPLHNIDSLSREERDSMHRHAFGYSAPSDTHTDELNSNMFASKLSGHMADHRLTDGASTKKLPEHMQKTIKYLADAPNKMTTKHKLNSGLINHDLHGGNVMARKTPTGPQLVVTDPFSHMSDINSLSNGGRFVKYKRAERQSKNENNI